MSTILFVIFVVLVQHMSCQEDFEDCELNMNVSEIIEYNGYPCENHYAITDDGYILSIQRIPYGINNEGESNKRVVFLQHGLLDSSFTWVNNAPVKSLAFILSNAGYDVWLGNTRGNIYSRSHKHLSPKSNAFWNFSWDEMAKYDFPAMINYVLDVTKAEKLSYIGHSQGTEIAFAKLSQNGPLNKRISSFVAIAPVAYLGNINSGLRYLSILAGPLNLATQLLNHGEFLPNDDFIDKLRSLVCTKNMDELTCSNILFLINGYGTSNLNKSRLSVYLSHVPSGTSSKNIVHYAQSCRSNKFQMYDYGFFGNLIKYWRISPPKYELNTNGVPIGIFFGGKDKSATPKDVSRAIKELGSSVKFKSFIPHYNHIDFIWGKDAADLVYKDLLIFINKYN